MARGNEYSPDLFLGRLRSMKTDVNEIATRLEYLSTHRAELSAPETQELNRIVPLMHLIATNAANATKTFNADREHLWATSYPVYAENIFKEAQMVRNGVHDYLELAKVRGQEQRLSHELSSGSGQ